ncbi:diguanylate cyclase [Salinisphaera sp. RV14]|uniref:GGDEF domain-containing protein n=1 Tax=Salinisphaera sp. RV14 TaxID=3454140 RepID=UPI003F86E831
MPRYVANGRYFHTAVTTMLSLALFASASATLMNVLSAPHRPLDLIVPPVMCALFAGLLIALLRRPRWLLTIARIALLASGAALIMPTWFYTAQAIMTSGLQLVTTLPPISALLLVLIVMVMIFFPGRQAIGMALLAWILVGGPVLLYLFGHPGEMWTPRGRALVMTYGPAAVMLVVLLPILRGMSGTIERLVSDRVWMEALINQDPLTGIHNRRVGEQILRDCLTKQAGAGLIMFDLDRFKAINDTYGHIIGDQVLTVVADRCKQLLRADACVSRWGGEEFLAVIPGADITGVCRLAERLREAIANAPIGPVPSVTASFGVTMLAPGDTLAIAVERADRRLYESKQRGRNCVVSSAALSAGAQPTPATPLDGGR